MFSTPGIPNLWAVAHYQAAAYLELGWASGWPVCADMCMWTDQLAQAVNQWAIAHVCASPPLLQVELHACMPVLCSYSPVPHPHPQPSHQATNVGDSSSTLFIYAYIFHTIYRSALIHFHINLITLYFTFCLLLYVEWISHCLFSVFFRV